VVDGGDWWLDLATGGKRRNDTFSRVIVSIFIV